MPQIDPPTKTNDIEIVRFERDQYFRLLRGALDQVNGMQAKLDNTQRDLVSARDELDRISSERQKRVPKEKYEQVLNDLQATQATLDQVRRDHRTAREDLSRLQQDHEQLRGERQRLQWQLQTAQDRVQALTRENESRERENERLRERLQQAQRGGAGPTVATAEFKEPEIGDPPTYAQEQNEHNHRKVYPENGGAQRLAGDWWVIGASRRGRGHEYGHLFRDDDFAVWPFDKGRGVAVAIADGLGSKPFSRWGARAAVLGALHAAGEREAGLAQLVSQLSTAAASSPKGAPDQLVLQSQAGRNAQAQSLIVQMLLGARTTVAKTAERNHKSADDLHSTLLVFIAIPFGRDFMYVASAQIGDGALRARQRPNPDATWSFMEQPQLNGVDNEVLPFMRFDPARYDQLVHTTVLEYPTFVVGMTDGTLDDIEGGPDEHGLFKGIEDFYGHIRDEALNDQHWANGLFDFLGYRRRASFDDRTLVCLVHRP